jgi:hypothetical protein
MVDRPTLQQIKDHPWLSGPTPSQDQVEQAMYRLKSKFIEKEVEHQSTELRSKNEKIRNRPMAKNFKDYALFCVKTNNVQALTRGLYKLARINFYTYARWALRCHYCRKNEKHIRWHNINQLPKLAKMKQHRHQQNASQIPPIWYQNSKFSYSFFASGSSSFLDFSMNQQKKSYH